jgi:hypothetical protein
LEFRDQKLSDLKNVLNQNARLQEELKALQTNVEQESIGKQHDFDKTVLQILSVCDSKFISLTSLHELQMNVSGLTIPVTAVKKKRNELNKSIEKILNVQYSNSKEI